MYGCVQYICVHGIYVIYLNPLMQKFEREGEKKKTLVNGLLNLESYPFSFFLLQEIYSDYI